MTPVKRVTLLRHAKSDWSGVAQNDFDRPLNKRGRNTAPVMGAFLASKLAAPDVILCSSAVRTKETLELILQAFGATASPLFTRDLYLASPQSALALIHNAPESGSHVLLVGHNPGTHMLAIDLADPSRSDPQALARMRVKYPTAAIAHFEFYSKDWRSIAPKSGKLIFFETPKRIQA